MPAPSPVKAKRAAGPSFASHCPGPRGECSSAAGRSMGGQQGMATDAGRPTPEHFLTLIRQQQRGRLKVYLGFGPGVGKTYEMLQEGQRLKRQGVDVVIGIVETHGRSETAAQIGEVEAVPRRRIEYHGVTLE